MHSADEAATFLAWLHPAERWVLTAIDPIRRTVDTETFRAETADALAAWLVRHAQHNIYYHVNRSGADLHKKASAGDITVVPYLHVDVDPRGGEGLAVEQSRILRMLEDPPDGVPPPTAVIFSGGGYNALWRLHTPLQSPEELEAADAYNQELERRLGGDHCHNIDRILRLPGTTNWPDARKIRRGRLPARAHVVSLHADRIYGIAQFTRARLAPRTAASVSGTAPRVESLDDLPDSVPGLVRQVITHGADPDDPARFPSRSEALFFVCCGLVRAGCPDEVILAVITDPNFRISESVLERRSGRERYALRQIGRARDHAISPELLRLNEKHAVIANLGGRCRIIEEVWDAHLERSSLTAQTFADFRLRYSNVRVLAGETADGEPIYQQLGRWWTEHARRRQYETLVFRPGHETPGAYNLWRGFACEPTPGDRHQPYMEHLRTVVCAGNEGHYRYLVGWLARAVQYPARPGETAVVLRGRQGTGKGFAIREFGRLWGRHFLQVSNPVHLVGQFNAHLQDCVVLFADEAFFAGDRRHESILKTLVTEDTIVVERKGIDAEVASNNVHMLLASNANWVVPADRHDRRFFVLDVSSDHARDSEYFARIRAALDDGGREHLLHYLQTYDLAEYDVRQIPATSALIEQKISTYATEEEWWYARLARGAISEELGWPYTIEIHTLHDAYLRYAQAVGVQRRASLTAFARFLSRAVPEAPRRRVAVRGVAVDLPDLDECRAHWDRECGGPYPWPSSVTTREHPPF